MNKFLTPDCVPLPSLPKPSNDGTSTNSLLSSQSKKEVCNIDGFQDILAKACDAVGLDLVDIPDVSEENAPDKTSNEANGSQDDKEDVGSLNAQTFDLEENVTQASKLTSLECKGKLTTLTRNPHLNFLSDANVQNNDQFSYQLPKNFHYSPSHRGPYSDAPLHHRYHPYSALQTVNNNIYPYSNPYYFYNYHNNPQTPLYDNEWPFSRFRFQGNYIPHYDNKFYDFKGSKYMFYNDMSPLKSSVPTYDHKNSLNFKTCHIPYQASSLHPYINNSMPYPPSDGSKERMEKYPVLPYRTDWRAPEFNLALDKFKSNNYQISKKKNRIIRNHQWPELHPQNFNLNNSFEYHYHNKVTSEKQNQNYAHLNNSEHSLAPINNCSYNKNGPQHEIVKLSDNDQKQNSLISTENTQINIEKHANGTQCSSASTVSHANSQALENSVCDVLVSNCVQQGDISSNNLSASTCDNNKSSPQQEFKKDCQNINQTSVPNTSEFVKNDNDNSNNNFEGTESENNKLHDNHVKQNSVPFSGDLTIGPFILNKGYATYSDPNKSEDEAMLFEKKLLPVIDHLLSIPEAANLRPLRNSPDDLLNHLVKLWGGNDANSRADDAYQRMKENFVSVVKFLFKPNLLSLWGWDRAPPEQILDDLLNSSEQGNIY